MEREYDINEVSEYERCFIQSDISGMFIEASFIEENDRYRVIYRDDGYLRADQCRFKDQVQILNLTEKVLAIYEKLPEYFILPDRLGLSSDIVYYRPSDEDVRLAFIFSEDEVLGHNIKSFLSQLLEKFESEEKDQVERLMELIDSEEKNPSALHGLIRKIRTENSLLYAKNTV